MLSSAEVTALFSAYCAMYSEDNAVNICNLYVIVKRFSSICVGAEKYGSKAECRYLRRARVLASWNGGDGQISATSPLSPGLVEYFMCHKLTKENIILLMCVGLRNTLRPHLNQDHLFYQFIESTVSSLVDLFI